jgi:hypothetical protein
MAHCKRVVDIHVCQCCQLLSKAWVVLNLALVKAQVLQETALERVMVVVVVCVGRLDSKSGSGGGGGAQVHKKSGLSV